MRRWVAQLPERSGQAEELAVVERGIGHRWGLQPEATGGGGEMLVWLWGGGGELWRWKKEAKGSGSPESELARWRPWWYGGRGRALELGEVDGDG